MGLSPRIVNDVWEIGPPTPTFRYRPPEGKVIFHEGRDLRSGDAVGFIVFRPPWGKNPDVRRDARHGVERLRRLDHPHVARVLDVAEDDDTFALVTEPLSGEDLRRRIRYRAATFTEAEAVRIVGEIAAGLAHAHERGVVFGNIKPTNVDLTDAGGAKITALPKPPFQFTSFLGAAAYLGYAVFTAPEVLQGAAADARTDVYGLGITAYELVGGNLPSSVTGNLATDLTRVVEQEWPAPAEFLEDVDGRLNDVIMRCLCKDPARRFASAAAVVAELRKVRGRSAPLISQARLLEIVTAAFPAPLAALARSLARDDHLVTQKDKLLNQANGLIGYLGFLAALSLGRRPEGLQRPSLGHWVALVAEALRDGAAGWPFSEFRGQIADGADLLNNLNELVRLRNAVAHGTAPGEDADLHDWVLEAGAVVRRLYKGLLFLARYALFVVEDLDYADGEFRLRVRRLEGAAASAAPVFVTRREPCGKGKVYFAGADFARLLCLEPFVVQARCPRCSQAELFFYASTQGGQRRYVTPDRGHQWSCPA